MIRASALLACAWLLAGCVGVRSTPADCVLRGGRISTLDPQQPEVRALAIRDGRVVFLGDDQQVQAYMGANTQVIELQGQRVIPGIVESHAHLLGVGEMREMLDLRQATSWAEVVRAVELAARELPKGTWILGRGWHQEKWSSVPSDAIDGWPTRAELDRVAPEHPVRLEHASGHATIVNARALELAGIDGQRTDPPGGRIVRDARGQVSGVLNENAASLVDPDLSSDPATRRARVRRLVALAGQECLSWGITSFHDAGESLEVIDELRAMAHAGQLPLRLAVMVGGAESLTAQDLAKVRMIGIADGMLTVRAIKCYADGALGSRGAWLLEPYSDQASTRGLPTQSMAALAAQARLARDHGFQLCVHAIGDAANREVLNLYQQTIPSAADLRAQRWRIEHAQHIDPADQARFAALGVIAAVQTVHCISDGPWVPARIGAERARTGAYPWRTLVNSGAVLCNGTDAPVESLDPFANFHAAVTRQMSDGRAFEPEQRLTREQALHAATLAGAYAAFQERELGSLSVGKRADLVVLNQDLLQVPEDQIRATRVELTMLGGKIVYRAP